MKRILLLLLIAVSGFAVANTDNQLWFGFIHQGRLHKHWGYWLDIHHRTKNEFMKNLHTEIFRFGGTYFYNNDLRFTIGYAGIIQFPSLTNQNFLKPEHRAWQQIFFTYTNKNFRVIQYLRSEQRFIHKTAGEKLVDGYVFRQRFRYNVMFIVLFNKKEFKAGSVGLVLNDEVFVNAYSEDKVKSFDQNRAFGGLCYQLNNSTQLQLGYLNVFAFTPKGNEMVHGIRLFAFHNIDWRKKK